MNGRLIFKNGIKFEGKSFGAQKPTAGEIVFATGMVGYPESLTDPSYAGQILVFTYPLLGSYGVPDKSKWESSKIQAAGIIVSNYIDTPSHHSSKQSLASWLKKENIPGLEIKDTRAITKILRERGSTLGKIVFKQDVPFADPNKENLVAKVSTKKPATLGKGKTCVLFDCGAKKNIQKELAARGLKVIKVPWNYDIFKNKIKPACVVISNGPGDPKMATETIQIIRECMNRKIPVLGICLGNQILALAAGGDTYKLKFGHRGQNQPCTWVGSDRSFLTTQNHGFAVGKIPKDFKPWFTNANDGTNEGIIHKTRAWMSVQFHPESTPGPTDTTWVFDYFLKKAKLAK